MSTRGAVVRKKRSPLLTAASVCSPDLPLALVRFIVPVIAIGIAAYIFRLFAFGWRIYRPVPREKGRGRNDFTRQVNMVREGRYLPYIDAMGAAIRRDAGDVASFDRLRAEFLELGRESSQRNLSARDAEIDEVVGQIIQLYGDATGSDGLSLSDRWGW